MDKKAKLTKEEIKFIYEHCLRYTDKWIADRLGRPTALIKSCRLRLDSEHNQISDIEKTNIAKKILHRREDWPTIRGQYTREEIKLFEFYWSKLMIQFGETTPTEELQIFELINIKLMMVRVLTNKRNSVVEIDKKRRYRDKHIKDSNNDDVDLDLLAGLDKEILSLQSADEFKTKEYKELLEQYDRILKSLKATRDQRIARVENSQTSFAEWIRVHEEEKRRHADANEMEIMKVAMKLEQERLAEYHTYLDGSVDQPFLTPETVLDDVIEEDTTNE
jgi:hypothetical protein